MRRLLLAASLLVLFTAFAFAQAPTSLVVTNCGAQAWTAGETGRPEAVKTTGELCVYVNTASQYPAGSTPITASATGTTLATAATLSGAASVTTYICGFSVRANATAAATANSTVTGTISGTLNFTQWTAPLASGIGITEQQFFPCIPASAVNTSIVVTSAAPGAGGVVSTTAWGYRQ